MDRKRVFFVLPSMRCGGVEKVASILMNHLDRERYEFKVVLFNRIGEFLGDVPQDVEIIDLKKRSRVSFFSLILKMRRLIVAQKPDILLSALYYPNVVTVLANLFLTANCRIIISEHSPHQELLPFKRLRGLVRLLMFYTYRKAHKIVAVSQGIKKLLVADFKILPDHVRVINNPVVPETVRTLSKLEVFHPFFESKKNGYTLLISVGRLTRQKNYRLLIEALARVRRRTPTCLLILGDGEQKKELLGLAEELGVRQYVSFVGYQANPYNWIKKADIFVLSSSWEGLPVAVIEAMVCGTPVVSTNWPPGADELIEDFKTGRLVPTDDVDSLSQAIIEVAKDRRLKKRIVERAITCVERYHYSKTVRRYERIFEEVVLLGEG